MKNLLMTTALIVAGSASVAFAQETTNPETLVPPAEEGTTEMPADGMTDDMMTDDTMTDDMMTDDMMTDPAVTDATPEANAGTTLEADMVNPMADMAGWIEPIGFVPYQGEALTAEILMNAAVYDVMNNPVSAISDFVLDDQGAITHAIIDVGGFLGMGQRSVAIPFEEMVIYQEVDASLTADGVIITDTDPSDDAPVVTDGTVTDPNNLAASDLRIYLPMTEDQLEALPEVDI